MGLSILAVIAILALAAVGFRRSPDALTRSDRQARWLLLAALALMGIVAVFFLYLGIGEVVAGDWSGAIHLASAVMLILLMFLAWRRPLEGGAALIGLGCMASLYYAYATMEGGRDFQVSSLLGGAPFLVCGLLFLAAAALARRKRAVV